MSSLENKFQEAAESTRFYIIKKNSEIVAFLAYEKEEGLPKDLQNIFIYSNPHDVEHLSAFNVNPKYQQSLIGEFLLNKSLSNEYTETVLADCSIEPSIASMYIENGFIATKYYLFEGKPSISIMKSFVYQITTQGLSQKGIVSLSEQPEAMAEYNIIIVSADNPKNINFDYINNGYSLQRYFKHSDNKWYACFGKCVPEEI